MRKIEEILSICERINKEEDFSVNVVKTAFSTTIILTDENGSYEEVIVIERESYLRVDGESVYQEPERVHIVSECVDHTELTFKQFHANFTDNWRKI